MAVVGVAVTVVPLTVNVLLFVVTAEPEGMPVTEEEKTYGHYSDYHHFTDGTFTRQEGYDYGLDRKGFEKELNGLKEVLEIHEDYQRKTNPKEMEMRLFMDEELGIFVEYENRNYIIKWI